MQTKTHSELVRRAAKSLGNGFLVNHGPTPHNELGQSGVQTFVDDILDVVFNSRDEADAFKRLSIFMKEGFVEIK